MKKEVKQINGYHIETYQVTHDLSFSVVFSSDMSEGKANGGLRFCCYRSQAEQEQEALMLAIRMTQKHMIYDTGFSGVKLVANGVVNEQNKKILLRAISKVLNEKSGEIYTGCDMNINNEDMAYLKTLSPYILNSMSAPHINTSIATAWGVYGSLCSVIDHNDETYKKMRFVVNGVGKIGSIIATELVRNGHEVFTYDIDHKNADILGATNISDRRWEDISCDYLLLCSASNVIHHNNVNQIKCRWIISSANSPFENTEVEDLLKKKNIHWIPDVVSNAGAVICDSIEFYEPDRYSVIEASSMYSSIKQCIYHKTNEILALSSQYNLLPGDALDIFLKIKKNNFVFLNAA